ncbi:AsmA family protein [Bathymodiolus septemdierum thioautotrophic gill symbiont]|uniref:Phage-related tail protein n=1 Tax=endosymbiont of Bathymodiolus septemdierum str. Myojin knoll TaxID=1303921 RepID=A0A0P0UQ87_9GAMM|nr:hypothetical protein [Bathymodiolus septemdierum thioautotrophic gill symbiont]BAS67126.1 conserved hypothetical protein [endosymbiont of Bathymodiolus septemdierum str. Myojin knoll]
MKKIAYILFSLVIVVVIAIMLGINPMGKKYAQEYASELLKTPVSISQFDASLLEKSLNIDFVEVQNPPNFKNKNALSLDYFSLKVGDIDDSLIVIDEIKLDGLKFILEQNSSKVNLIQLLDNLEKPSQNSTSTSAGKSAAQEKRIKIKHFKVSNISLKVDTKWLKSTLKVPNISVRNFGGASGAKVDEIGKALVKEVLHNLKKALEKEGINAGKKEIEASLRRKIEQKLGIENGLGGIKKQFNADEINNKVKGLFKELGF